MKMVTQDSRYNSAMMDRLVNSIRSSSAVEQALDEARSPYRYGFSYSGKYAGWPRA